MDGLNEERQPSFFWTLFYWVVLFVTLLLFDDAIFGWVFWFLSQYSIWISFALALVIYWSVGYWLTLRGLRPTPGKWAGKALKQLQLEKKNPELQQRQNLLRNKVRSVKAAVPLTLVLGGVVTTLWLRRHNVIDDRRARRLGFWLAGLYAIEFALVHAVAIGGLIFWARS